MDAETQRQTPKLRTNLDTNFLKLFAILTMVVDHVGTVFFPQHPEFRWVGRLAFPIFCYCLTVGLMYTRDIRRYLGRLALFAVVSQPFFALAFHPHNFWEELTSWNIFVTLFFSLLAIYGVKERKWWWFLHQRSERGLRQHGRHPDPDLLPVPEQALAGDAALCAELPPGSLGRVPGGPNGPGGGGTRHRL